MNLLATVARVAVATETVLRSRCWDGRRGARWQCVWRWTCGCLPLSWCCCCVSWWLETTFLTFFAVCKNWGIFVPVFSSLTVRFRCFHDNHTSRFFFFLVNHLIITVSNIFRKRINQGSVDWSPVRCVGGRRWLTGSICPLWLWRWETYWCLKDKSL